ncbi:ABC transporter permease [Motilibacter deserti]|uniref:ABC transporter permease n=1 Tax=Motilibacter deserti TaxID=2714956 RepID=A0ABX0H1U7_9ACTN|nr:ABC transporter permease [Motilibacter deserti]NHC15408.1 ABC transporter permease [Motilibacter deserti]
MSTAGVLVVARGELRQRVRAGRWRWLLAAWVAVLAAFTVLLRLALSTGLEPGQEMGPPLFGGLMLFVLGLAMLVVPSLTAQSVNGDRERGLLAPLQVTLLTPWEIALGKLAAAWGVALLFLALALPFAVWSLVEGGVGAGQLLVAVLVEALLLGVVCAIGLGLSAALSRSTTSAVLTYLAVFALSAGTLIAFGLALVATSEAREEAYYDGDGVATTYMTTEDHPERVWWLLAPNPFVVLADAAPRNDPGMPRRYADYVQDYEPEPLDPLGEIGRAVREARDPEAYDGWYSYGPYPPGGGITAVVPTPGALPEPGVAYDPDVSVAGSAVDGPREAAAVWPWGLGFDLLLGAGAVWLAARRLRAPAHRLGKGSRIA